jgi:hypothetical protein
MRKGICAKLQASDRWALGLPLVVLAALYLLTAPRSVTFEDAGLFLTTSFHWGLPHPPGYPLYTALTHFLMQVVPLEAAIVGSLMSILCGLGAVAGTYFLFLEFAQPRALAALGCLLVGLGQTFWNQMVVPEVYALHTLLFVWLWVFALRTARAPSQKHSIIMFWLLGLSLANHWPLVIVSGPLVLFAVWPVRNLLWRRWPQLAGGLALSFSIYLLLYVRSRSGTQYLFLGPMGTLSDVWGYITRSYYKLADSQAPFKAGETLKFIGSYVWNQGVLELTPLSLPLFIAGFRQLWSQHRHLALQLLYGLLSTSVVLATSLHFEFNELNYNVFRVFHLIPHVCFVFVCIVGVQAIAELQQKWGYAIACALVSATVLAATTFGALTNNFRGDDLAEGYSKLILDSLPKNAVLFAATDADVGPMAYVNGVLGHRSDVRLMTQTGVFFPDRLFDPFEFGRTARTKATKDFLSQHAPVYSTKKFDILEKEKNLPLNFKYNGIYYLVDASFVNEPPKTREMIEAADRLATAELQRPWLFNWRYHRNVVMSRLCNLLVLNGREDHRAFSENRSCRVVLAKHLRATKRFAESSAILRQIIANDSRFMVSSEIIDMYNVDLLNQLDFVNVGVQGAAQKMAHVRDAVEFASQSLNLYDGCDHPVAEVIQSIQPNPGWTTTTETRLRKFQECQKPARS